MVYALSLDAQTIVTQIATDFLRLSSDRSFTRWGSIRWFNTQNTAEEGALSSCTLAALSPGEAHHHRAVVWGAALTMLIFGALPVAPTANPPSWQLIVCDGMCSPLFETISSRRRGGA